MHLQCFRLHSYARQSLGCIHICRQGRRCIGGTLTLINLYLPHYFFFNDLLEPPSSLQVFRYFVKTGNTPWKFRTDWNSDQDIWIYMYIDICYTYTQMLIIGNCWTGYNSGLDTWTDVTVFIIMLRRYFVKTIVFLMVLDYIKSLQEWEVSSDWFSTHCTH